MDGKQYSFRMVSEFGYELYATFSIFGIITNLIDEYLQIGNKAGENFGWIAHLNCSDKCPNKCKPGYWWFWDKEKENNGTWYVDKNIEVCGKELVLYTSLFSTMK